MPKLLRAVRLDESDEQVFHACGAAADGDPVVTGGFATCDFEGARRCERSCHCEASFLALDSWKRCTIAEVVEVSEAQLDERVDALARHLMRACGAPSWEEARRVAEEEVRHTAEVCETLAPEVWITVRRTRAPGAEAIDEQYSVYDRLLIGAHG